MEPLVLPVLELMRGMWSVAGGGLLGLALIVSGYLGILVCQRWLGRCDGISIAADESRPVGSKFFSPESSEHNATQSAEILKSQKVTGKAATIRWAMRGLGLAGVLFAGSLLVIEAYGTEPILNWSFRNLEARTGVRLTFAKASGGLLSGSLVLRQVHVVRENHPESNFDLTCSQMAIRFSVFEILCRQMGFHDLRIDQISGMYQRLSPVPGTDPPKLPRAARNFPIGHLQINDATIDFSDATVDGEPVKFALLVKSLECRPFRTAYAPYEVIFRSNVEGTIDDHPFSVQSTNTTLGPKTVWRVTGMPINLAGSYLGGPFRWLREGECDIKVEQQMRENPRGPVTLDAQLVLRNIQPGVPGDIKPAVAIAAQLLMTKLKKLPKEKELRFTLNLDPDKFDLTTTASTGQLWQQFKSAAVASMLQTAGVNLDGLPEATQKKLHNVIDNAAGNAIKLLESIGERRKAKKAAKEKQPAPE